MGIWDKPQKDFLDKLAKEFSFEPPRENGLDVVESIKARYEGRAKVFFAMGGNFVSATSDTEVHRGAALRKCKLTAHVSIKLNRSHVVTGRTALILPCLGRTEIDRQAGGEQFMTVEDSMGVINPSRGKFLEPASPDLLSEGAPSLCGLAKTALGPKKPIDWDAYVGNYDLIRDKIEAVIPGFPAFNDRIRQGNFFICLSESAARSIARSRRRPARRCSLRGPRCNARAPNPATILCPGVHHPEPRPVQHHGLRIGRPLSRDFQRTPGHFHERGRHGEGGLGAGATGGFDEPFQRRETPRAFVHGRAVSDSAPLLRRLLSGKRTCWCPSDSTADKSNCPASKSIPITIQASARQHMDLHHDHGV